MTPDRNVVEEKGWEEEFGEKFGGTVHGWRDGIITFGEVRAFIRKVAEATRAAERERLRGVVEREVLTGEWTGSEIAAAIAMQDQILKALTPPEAPAPNDTK